MKNFKIISSQRNGIVGNGFYVAMLASTFEPTDGYTLKFSNNGGPNDITNRRTR